ncbi:hypothetical protein N8593_00305 [bacterium]|nr:hypothetical protein [bacterium]MDA7663913.1 hypothetical protein [bacterium]
MVPEVSIDKNTPPSFVVIAHGDSRFVEGAALYYLAMHRAKRDCELHIYGKGGHGYGMKKNPTTSWRMDYPSRRMDEGDGIPRLMRDQKKWDAEFPFMNRPISA